jgi:hypothetical protein
MIQNKVVHTYTVKHQKGRKELARRQNGRPVGRRKRFGTFHRLFQKGFQKMSGIKTLRSKFLEPCYITWQ